MRSRSSICLAVGVLVGAAFCTQATSQPHTSQNHAQKYRHSEPATHRPVIEKAIRLVNAVVNPGLRLPLRASWVPGDRDAVPVYLVAGPSFSAADIALVPPRERCIFFVSKGVERIQGRLKGYGKAGLDYQPEEPLALVLLHELGHIYYGDAGTKVIAAPFQLGDLDKPLSQIRNPEIRADLFAASHIRNALKPGAPAERFTAGIALNLFLPKVSWNLSSQRVLGEFGGTVLNKPSLFLDRGDTHPNFELRFLVMEYALNRGPAARDLLLSFIQHRDRALQKQQKPAVLYQKAAPPGKGR